LKKRTGPRHAQPMLRTSGVAGRYVERECSHQGKELRCKKPKLTVVTTHRQAGATNGKIRPERKKKQTGSTPKGDTSSHAGDLGGERGCGGKKKKDQKQRFDEISNEQAGKRGSAQQEKEEKP